MENKVFFGWIMIKRGKNKIGPKILLEKQNSMSSTKIKKQMAHFLSEILGLRKHSYVYSVLFSGSYKEVTFDSIIIYIRIRAFTRID